MRQFRRAASNQNGDRFPLLSVYGPEQLLTGLVGSMGEQLMSMRITLAAGACLAAALVISVASAQAQTIYFGGEAGWTLLQDQTSRASGFPTARSSFDSGFAAGARLGYELGPWRFEEEYVYRRNGLSNINVAGVNIAGVKGNRQ